MNIVDKAWEILKKFEPNLTLDVFLEKLKPTFEQNSNLSKNDIVLKMLEYIKKDKPFGEIIATAAEKALSRKVSVEEASNNIEKYVLTNNANNEEIQTSEIFNKSQPIPE
ncbi:hypothetical protein [Scytonema sp. PRP1]|uniref:hypothetical protein n=1 Tax=Scytonema sp. PRP1 TaxID=3120513 RepID=UPI002FCEE821